MSATVLAAIDISRDELGGYLRAVLGKPVDILGLRALGGDGNGADPKALGYGAPFEIDCVVDDVRRSYVLSRTRPARGYGHDYPADRAWQALYGHTAYNTFPRHVRSVDVGFARASGELVSAGDATQFFQLVEKAEGDLYWLDLERLRCAGAQLTELDVLRAETLARFLAEAHADKRDDPALYTRRLRELVGHGECLMGILDAYPHPYPPLPPDVCESLEHDFVSWRWRLRTRTHRLSRVHGDFHPWNILFRRSSDFSVLDRSRGEWGEPADDVAALAVNYLFFGMRRGDELGDVGVAEPFRRLFERFLRRYVTASGDYEIFETLPPFFAFRALVLAHPYWYPSLSESVRGQLLHFARSMAVSNRFDPADVSWLCGAAR
jgi:aminoglycoside phosphotransferase (APT) family kinase protein